MAISLDEGLLTEELETKHFVKMDENGIELVNAVWDDIRVPLTAFGLAGIKDPGFAKLLDNGARSTGVFTHMFSATIAEELFFAVQMPHNWKLQSDIEAHIHWIPTAAGAAGADVCWGLEYSLAQIGGVFGDTTIIYGDVNHLAEDLVAKKQYLTELGSIDMNAVNTISAMLICRVFRDATGVGGTDDYAADAALLEVDFHYQIDGLGSPTEYLK